MAIKILKKGRLPEEVEYKFLCDKCSAVFVATPIDGKTEFNTTDGLSIIVSCPTCGTLCSSSIEYKEEPKYLEEPKLTYPSGVRSTIGLHDFGDDPTGYY